MKAFQIKPEDNVATLLDDAGGERIEITGAAPGEITLREPIESGHKVALADLAAGAPIVKYGHVIGVARAPIRRGDWVHLHNLASQYDARSGDFDAKTGATRDTAYE